MTLSAGTRLGPYEILAPIGTGGMGEVYKAKDARLGRDVALKVLPAEMSQDSERLARFEQEARSASALNHPGIVTIFEIGKADSSSYIAMELVPGRTLREILADGPMPAKRVLTVGAQIADALARAHEAGIVHRDLKPENLMVTRDGFVKILDFGLAKVATPVAEGISQLATAMGPTRPGVVMGTVGYMSPEQAAGRAIDYRSDQFSLGSILYEMITGKRAFQKDTGVETLSAIIREEPRAIAEIVPEAPAPVKWITERCLAKDPEERYASTRDLARELGVVRDHLGEVSRSGEAAAALGAPRTNRRLMWVGAGLALGLVAGAVTVWALLREKTPPEPTTIRYLTYSGRDTAPAVSPDGRTVAFSSERDGRPRIWLKQLDGGGEVPLTDGPDLVPRFSPDGSQILFARSAAGQTDLYRVPTVGGETRRIVSDAAAGDWSPDGSRVAFLRYGLEENRTTSEVWTISSSGGEAKRIAALPGRQLVHPRWSPDGGTVATTDVGTGGAFRLFFLFDVGSGRFREIDAGSVGIVSSVAWTRSPHEIVYLVSESAAGNVTGSAGSLVRRDLKTGAVRKLFWTPTNGEVLDLAGPGRVVFDVRSPIENLKEYSIQAGRPVGDGVWLTRGNSGNRQPTYSPDGKWILFSSSRSGNLDLWMISTTSGLIRRVTDDAAEDWDPGFARDGKRILWSSNRSGGVFEIWTADADGTNARQVTRTGSNAENPTETPDGWIVFNRGAGAESGLWTIRPDGSDARQIVSGTTVLPDVSPDGRYVAYRVNFRVDMHGLRVARVSDGSATKFRMDLSLRRGFAGNSIARSRWMPDGKAIVFVGQDEAGNYGLFVQDFDPDRDTTATRRKLLGFDPDIALESMGISPDGTRVATAGPEQSTSIMLAEHVPGVDRPAPK